MVIKWAVTNRCNLKCKYCYNSDLRTNCAEISRERAEKLIRDFKRAYITEVQFLGGEPLLRNDIADLVRCCSEVGLSTWITTNGVPFNRALIDQIMANGLRKLYFSIDGPNSKIHDNVRGIGTFEQTTTTLEYAAKLAQKYHTYVAVNSVLGKDALQNIGNYYSFLCKYEMNEINLNVPDIQGNAKNNLDLIGSATNVLGAFEVFASMFNQYHPKQKTLISLPPLILKYFDNKYRTSFYIGQLNYCMGGSSTYFVDADGILYPCNMPVGIKHFRTVCKSYSENNLHSRLFSELYWTDSYLSFFQMARKNDTSITKGFQDSFCASCYFAAHKICGNACPLHSPEEQQKNSLFCKILCNRDGVDYRKLNY